jgi:hypothetical protein
MGKSEMEISIKYLRNVLKYSNGEIQIDTRKYFQINNKNMGKLGGCIKY